MTVIQPIEQVVEAYRRIKSHIYYTPIIESEEINNMFSSRLYFKLDSLQKTGAFKIRGVLNHLLALQEKSQLPTKVSTYSTGNHAIALAFAAQYLNFSAFIYLPKNVSEIKKKIIASYTNTQIIETDTRVEAEVQSKEAQNNGCYYLHPSDSDLSIAGVGTMCYEALIELPRIDAIFAPCGGGGLLSGSYLAKELLSSNTALIGCEPYIANDAYLSLQRDAIFRFPDSPNTIADGLRALSLSKRTFTYLKKLDDFFITQEEGISYWTHKLNNILKVSCEPSACLALDAIEQWLNKYQMRDKKILVLVSGGNFSFNDFTKE